MRDKAGQVVRQFQDLHIFFIFENKEKHRIGKGIMNQEMWVLVEVWSLAPLQKPILI